MKKGFSIVNMLIFILVLGIMSLAFVIVGKKLLDEREKIDCKETVENYIIKLNNKILENNMDDDIENNIKDDIYTVEDTNNLIDIKIDSGSVLVDNGKVTNGEFKIGKVYLIYDGTSIEISDKANKFYKNGDVIYFNPIDNKVCTSEEENCMKWYAFNDTIKNENLNLILDHNIKSNIKYEELENTIKENTYEVRNITLEDILKITDNNNFKNDSYYLDSNNYEKLASKENISKYDWLYNETYDCMKNGCTKEDTNKKNKGYIVASNELIYAITNEGKLINIDEKTNDYGVRPVITLNKNIIN